MKLICNSILRFVGINLFITSLLVFLLWYSGKFTEGVLFYIGVVLDIPVFFVISLFRGMNVAMHFTTYKTFIVVSIIFYSILIAFVQLVFIKFNKRKRE